MGFTTVLMTVSLVTITSAGFPSGWYEEDNPFAGSPLMTMRFGNVVAPPAPAMNFPDMPNPLSLTPFPAFTMPPFTMPKVPTEQEIANAKPADGGTFTGMVVKTQTNYKKNKNGTLVKDTVTSYLTNINGNVKVGQIGDSAPPSATNPTPSYNSDAPKINRFKQHKFKPKSHFGNFDNFGDFNDFDSFDHTFPTMKPIDPEKIKTHVPAKGETYKGHSVRHHTSYSDVDGVIKQEGTLTKVKNDNGLVEQVKLAYHGTNK